MIFSGARGEFVKTKKLKILIISILVLCSYVVTISATSVDQDRKSIKDKETEAANIEKQMKNLEAERKNLVLEAERIAEEEVVIGNEIDKLNQDMTDKKIEIKDTEEKLEVAKLEEAQQYDTLMKRISFNYENPSRNPLEILLQSQNLGEFYRRAEYIRAIAEYDKQLLADLEESRKDVEATGQKLEEDLALLAKMEEESQSKLAEKKTVRTLKLAKNNELKQKGVELEGRKENLEKEVKELEAVIKKKLAELNLQKYNGRLRAPVEGVFYITSKYGKRKDPFTGEWWTHYGIDFRAPTGTPIVSGDDGQVIFSGWKGGYGNTVMVAHGSNLVTLYAHNSKLLVKVGDKVTRGERIALAGSTGRSTGPHCHFEVRVDGKRQDPLGWITN